MEDENLTLEETETLETETEAITTDTEEQGTVSGGDAITTYVTNDFDYSYLDTLITNQETLITNQETIITNQETIILQQDNIYSEIYNINGLAKNAFGIVFIIFVGVIIYKFLKFLI